MSQTPEVAFVENLDESEVTALVRIVASLDPTEGSATDSLAPRWNADERELILNCQEAAEEDGDDEEETASDYLDAANQASYAQAQQASAYDESKS